MERNKQPSQAELLQGAEQPQATPVNDKGAAMVEGEISVSPEPDSGQLENGNPEVQQPPSPDASLPEPTVTLHPHPVTSQHMVAGNQAVAVGQTGIVRYINGYPVLVNPETGETSPLALPQQPSKFWRWTKRLLMPIIMPLLLFIIGLLTLALIGPSGVDKINNIIATWWWPATFFRLGIYFFLSWGFFGFISRRIRNTALMRVETQRQYLFEQGIPDHEVLMRLDAMEARIRTKRLPSWWLFAVLLAFDLLAIQLPYFLR
ncbi:MAG: hypothetical protein ACFN9G_00985 [Cardiobacterium sp.]|jgi:hypothetical protein